MSIESKIDELIAALNANTDAILAGGDLQAIDNAKVQAAETEPTLTKQQKAAQTRKANAAAKEAARKEAARKEAEAAGTDGDALTIEQVRDALTTIDRELALDILARCGVKDLGAMAASKNAQALFAKAINLAETAAEDVKPPSDALDI